MRVLLAAAALALVLVLLGDPTLALPPDAGSRDPHAPIAIRSDTDFDLPSSGVRSGSGTAEDPYVISGWQIVLDQGDALVLPPPAGILVEKTTKHFVVRDVLVDMGPVEAAAINLSDVQDTAVEASVLRSSVAGLVVADAERVMVTGTHALTPPGLLVARSESVTVAQNRLAGVDVDASFEVAVHDNALEARCIVVRDSGNVTLRDNTHAACIALSSIDTFVVAGHLVLDAGAVDPSVYPSSSPIPPRIVVEEATDGFVADNEGSGGSWGLWARDVDGTTIVNNTFTGALDIGLVVTQGHRVKVVENAVEAHRQGFWLVVDGSLVEGNSATLLDEGSTGFALTGDTNNVVENRLEGPVARPFASEGSRNEVLRNSWQEPASDGVAVPGLGFVALAAALCLALGGRRRG